MIPETELAKVHQLFDEHCREEAPWGSSRLDVVEHYLALLPVVRDCLSVWPLPSATQDELILLKSRLRDAAQFESPAIKNYVEHLIAIADTELSRPNT